MKPSTLLVLGVFALLLFLVAACGGGDEPTPTPTPTPTTPPKTPTTLPPSSDLEINTLGDQLKYDRDFMSASAGSPIVVTYTNNSSVFQHNWVLVRAGTKDEVARDGGTAGLENNYIPPNDDRIIAFITPLVEPGEVGEVRFEAPAPGTYEFVCTFPGHNATKFGTFEVK